MNLNLSHSLVMHVLIMSCLMQHGESKSFLFYLLMFKAGNSGTEMLHFRLASSGMVVDVTYRRY
jgi:hypothetical protein